MPLQRCIPFVSHPRVNLEEEDAIPTVHTFCAIPTVPFQCSNMSVRASESLRVQVSHACASEIIFACASETLALVAHGKSTKAVQICVHDAIPDGHAVLLRQYTSRCNQSQTPSSSPLGWLTTFLTHHTASSALGWLLADNVP